MKHPVFAATLLLLASAAANAQSTLEVLDFGAQPRSTIRYQFKPGQVDRATMDMAMKVSMEMNGEKMPAMDMPGIKSTVELRVVDVAADGSARLEFKIGSAEGPVDGTTGQAEQALMNRTLAGLTRVSGSYRTDTRGRTLDAKVSIPNDMLPAGSQQAMNDMMDGAGEDLQQFPEEVVGVGARWKVTRRIEMPGMQVSMVQVQEFTLKSRSRNQVELLVKGGGPIVVGADAPAGATGSAETSASGTILIDLQKLVPTMSMVSTSSSSATMPGPNGARTMKSSGEMRMSVVPIP